MKVPVSMIDGAAIAEAGRQFDYPATVTWNGALFNISTAGILPTGSKLYNGLDISDNSMFNDFAGLQLPKRYQIDGGGRVPHPSGFLTSYVVDQQGFSVDVACQQRSSTTLPSLTTSGSPPLSGLNPSGIIETDWVSICPNGMTPATKVFNFQGNTNYVVSTLCLFQNMSSRPASGPDPSTHLFVLLGQGSNYSFIGPTVCSVKPILTTARVEYGPTIDVSDITSTRILAEPPTSASAAALGSLVMSVMNGRVSSSQTLTSNTFGDNLNAVFQSVRIGGGGDADNAVLNKILEAYIKGAAEFMGTVVRTGLSAKGVWPNDELPTTMMAETTGHLRAETIGFNYESAVGFITLLPTSFVTIVSIVLTVYSFTRRPGEWDDESMATGIGGGIGMRDNGRPSSSEFDPTNPFHLIVAASAGGMTAIGDSRDEVVMAQLGRMKVRLGLVKANEWTGFIPDGY